MLNPDWPLALRLLVVALPIAAAIWFFSTGWVAVGAVFTLMTAVVFYSLFLQPPAGRP